MRLQTKVPNDLLPFIYRILTVKEVTSLEGPDTLGPNTELQSLSSSEESGLQVLVIILGSDRRGPKCLGVTQNLCRVTKRVVFTGSVHTTIDGDEVFRNMYLTITDNPVRYQSPNICTPLTPSEVFGRISISGTDTYRHRSEERTHTLGKT